MSITVVAQYRVEHADVDAVRGALRQMVIPSRNESGCLAYDVYVDPDDDTLVMIVERYRDEAAFQSHVDSTHFEALLRGIVLPRLVERVRYDLVPLPLVDA
jgi:quinol monooxygenase YgiN